MTLTEQVAQIPPDEYVTISFAGGSFGCHVKELRQAMMMPVGEHSAFCYCGECQMKKYGRTAVITLPYAK